MTPNQNGKWVTIESEGNEPLLGAAFDLSDTDNGVLVVILEQGVENRTPASCFMLAHRPELALKPSVLGTFEIPLSDFFMLFERAAKNLEVQRIFGDIAELNMLAVDYAATNS